MKISSYLQDARLWSCRHSVIFHLQRVKNNDFYSWITINMQDSLRESYEAQFSRWPSHCIRNSSGPWPIGLLGWGVGGGGGGRGHEEQFSRDPLPVISVEGHCEQFWHGHGCPLFDVVHPAFPLLTTASPTLKGALNQVSFSPLIVARKGSCGPTRKLISLRTKSLVLCCMWEMWRSLLGHLVLKAWTLFSESASRVHVSQLWRRNIQPFHGLIFCPLLSFWTTAALQPFLLSLLFIRLTQSNSDASTPKLMAFTLSPALLLTSGITSL